MTDRLPYLLCYDIRQPRRLRRVHRIMCGWGSPLQYSVFKCMLNQRERRQMLEELRGTIDERVDDVRLYQIETRARIRTMGFRPFALDENVFD